MAGLNITFVRPGYSSLYSKDLPYTEGTGETNLDPLDPNSARPLVEGEWLELASDGKHYTRGGNNNAADADEGANLAFLFFMERGRYDTQVSRKAHAVWGAYGYEIRCKACDSTNVVVGSKLVVADVADDDGIVRRWLALKGASGMVIGRCTRVYGVNDIGLVVSPSFG